MVSQSRDEEILLVSLVDIFTAYFCPVSYLDIDLSLPFGYLRALFCIYFEKSSFFILSY